MQFYLAPSQAIIIPPRHLTAVCVYCCKRLFVEVLDKRGRAKQSDVLDERGPCRCAHEPLPCHLLKLPISAHSRLGLSLMGTSTAGERASYFYVVFSGMCSTGTHTIGTRPIVGTRARARPAKHRSEMAHEAARCSVTCKPERLLCATTLLHFLLPHRSTFFAYNLMFLEIHRSTR